MQTSVPGNSSLRRQSGRGFTLVEVLLVLLIAGILAGGVLPSLAFRSPSAQDEAERLAKLIEHAQVMAPSLGSPIGLQVLPDGYEFLRWSGLWAPIDSGHLAGRRSLPVAMAIESLPDPDSGQAAPRIIRFPPAGYPPTFNIRLSGPGQGWLLRGNLAGRLTVENQGSTP